ncbi:hypothetical protein PT974_03819 [Cladobotryum mycophilum]|uniref:EF-hand domain-containing protein n=1 Tax=Cladobotryum mycophilum TaxID=491253 RepID=A0ABR0SUK1_9HYPO
MVFVYLGPTPESWAVGNDHYSISNNLPPAIQQVWDHLGKVCADPSMAGTMISWISTSPDGSYAIMTKGGEFLSNRQDLIATTHPHSTVDHVAFSPRGWFVRFADGSVQFSSPSTLPPTFHNLSRDLLDTNSISRQHRSQVRRVFFDGNGGTIISTDHGILVEGISGSVSASIRSFTYGDMQNAGIFLGKGTVICPWDNEFHVLEAKSLLGQQQYLYQLPPNRLSQSFIDDILSNRKPSLPPPPPYRAPTAVIHHNSMVHIPPEIRARFEGLFEQSCGGKTYLTGIETADIFMRSGLNNADLSRIWEKVDLNHDGRFDRNEFVQAMWLIELQTGRGLLQPTNDSRSTSHLNGSAQLSHSLLPPPPDLSIHQSNSPPAYQIAPVKQWQDAVPAAGEAEPMELKTAMICQGCDTGFLPDDIIYHCESCKGGKSSFCEKCHDAGEGCQHHVPRSKLQRAKKLPIKDKNGSLGFGVKCDGCKDKIKKGSLLWYCRRCLDPYFCQNCWRRSDKRCRHAAKGKITLKLVDKDAKADEEWESVIEEVVGAIIG